MGYLFAIFINSGLIKALFRDYLVFDLTVVTFVIILIVLMFNVFIGKRKIINMFQGRGLLVIVPFILFSLLILLSTLYTESPLYWKDKLYRIIILTLPSFLIPCLFFKYNDIKKFIVGSVFIYLIAMVDLSHLLIVYGIKAFDITRETGLPNYLTWGGFISYNALLFIGLLLSEKNNRRGKLVAAEWIIPLFALPNLFVVFISGARGPFIFFLCVFVGMLLVNKCRKIFIPITLCALLLITICTSIDCLSTNWLSIGRSKRILTLSMESTSVVKRLEYLKESWDIINERPVFGYGVGSFSYIVNGEDRRGYPHNIFLEIWFENGIIAMILFVLLIFSIMFIALKKINRPFVSSFFWVNIYFILNFMKSSSLTDARVFLAFAGILIATSYGQIIESRIMKRPMKHIKTKDYQYDH